MKKLWKYLSTLGLMFVAFLCLGVGLKASERVQAAKASDVYVGDGATYTINGGSVGTINIDGNSTVNISGGVVEDITDLFTGSVSGNCVVNVNGGTLKTLSLRGTSSTCKITSGTIESIVSGQCKIIYSGGTIGSIALYFQTLEFTKTPTSVINITSYRTDVGTQIAKVQSSSFDLTKLNVDNLLDGTKLEIQYISGSYYVVIAQTITNYTVTISAGTGGSVSRTSVSVPSGTTYSTSGRTLSFSNGTSVTATANTGYSFNYWSPSSGTITSSTTIYAYFSRNQTTTNYTVTISAGSGGRVSQTSVSVPSGTTFSTSGSRLTFSNGTSVTATANSGYTFDYWNPTSGTITSSRTIYAYFTSSSTPTPPAPQDGIYVGLDLNRRLTALERAILITLNNGATIRDSIEDGSLDYYMNNYVLEYEYGVDGDKAFFEDNGISYIYFEAPSKEYIDNFGVDIYFPLGSINGGSTSIEVSNSRYSYMSSYPGQLVTTSRADVLVIYEGDDPSVLAGSTLTHLSTDMSRTCDAVDRFCTYNDVTPDHVYVGSDQALIGILNGIWSIPVAIDTYFLDVADDYTIEEFFTTMMERGYSWFWLSDEGYDVDWYSFMYLSDDYNATHGSTIRSDLQYLRYTYPEFASAKWRYLQKGY